MKVIYNRCCGPATDAWYNLGNYSPIRGTRASHSMVDVDASVAYLRHGGVWIQLA